MNKKICLVNIFFGSWPEWIHYFVQSCKDNPEYTFLLFTSNIEHSYRSDNIVYTRLTTKKFNELVSEKLRLDIQLVNAYKLCDFKPTFGILFNDYLKDYDYWGYCDIDLIFGRIRKFITDEILQEYDVISVYKDFLSGPFTLFRNTTHINTLFKEIHDYKNILSSDQHFAMDENIIRDSLKGINFKKIVLFVYFIFRHILVERTIWRTLDEMRYQFQWYCKKKLLKTKVPVDMTEVIWLRQRKKEIKAYFEEVLFSDSYFKRLKKYRWKIEWIEGKLQDVWMKKEIFAFHFREIKNKNTFLIEKKESNKSFIITENGIGSGT